MLRAVALCITLSVVAVACGLVDPADTRLVRVEFHTERPVELTVTTPDGPLPDSVLPSTLPAGSVTDVAFYVPDVGEWRIAINGMNKVDGADLDSLVGAECTRLVIRLYADGAPSVACGHDLYTGVLRVSPLSKGYG